AGGPDGEVEERPLVARAAHDADVLTGFDAVGHQALGDRDHLGVELTGRDRDPRAVGRRLVLDQGVVGTGSDTRCEKRAEVLREGDLDEGGTDELVHADSSGRRMVGQTLQSPIVPAAHARTWVACPATGWRCAIPLLGQGRTCTRSVWTS